MGHIWHIIIAIVVFQVLGFIWYGPIFGKTWARVIGMSFDHLSAEEKKAMQKKMIPTYILNFVCSIVFILFYGFAFYASLLTSFGLGLVVYVGFLLPILAQNALWSGKSRKLTWHMFLIQAGYQLLSVIVLALLFA